MTRGKYAVKSANNRAQTAGQRAEHLKADLDSERQTHAAEVAALKATIEKLSAQLTGTVTELAAEHVSRVEAECAAQIRAERDRHRTAALEAFGRIGKATVYDPPSNAWHIPGDDINALVGDLAQVLGVPPGEAQDAGAQRSGLATDRATRRQDAKRHKATVTGQPYVVLRGIR